MYGPPGAGKTILAKTAASLLPQLNQAELLALNKIYGLIGEEITRRPFRAPHHSASLTAIIGGGQNLAPGEISLAHTGLLFLDEFPEFNRTTIEALRQPLQDHYVNISRAEYNYCFPADFQLFVAMNPCPCGYYGTNLNNCRCGMNQIMNYQRKISGPILDRFDMIIQVENTNQSDLLNFTTNSTQEHDSAKNTIQIAREHQIVSNNFYNSRLTSVQIANQIPLKPQARSILDTAASRLQFSTRSYFSIIKVARTIADMEQAEQISESHIAEAIHYRAKSPLI